MSKSSADAATVAATYLGPRGYTIHKENLDEEERKYIRTELTIRPYIPKAPVQPAAYPIYRESPLKMYVPRYFGIGAYGPPEAIKISSGDPITVAFQGEMRDYQKDIVRKYLAHVGCGGGGLLDVDPGKGKTVMALYILAQLRIKTLVVVHKSFLMNQWIERIEQFLPGARVGRIQGQIADIDDKDIVLGMLQSLSMKEYPADMFDSFGLTVFDEVHHMGAEVFCQCMMKVSTLYTLGLSGTMQRKDGLTKVFKMFLGDVVHKEKAASEHRVIVKAINYCVDDAAFNETEYDYRGNPKFSTMISRVCDYAHRSEFILRVLQRELAENPEQQVMILAHNKSLLTYLYKAIEHRGIAGGSVGYYVGGMKEADLKASESRTVIIATYAMASEGLDIKTLTTLIMASPKTDVCQSVGRILRVKHGRPLVIDIVDQQDIFRNQWHKRRAYYVKQNYDILMTDSPTYDAHNPVQWAPDHVAKTKDLSVNSKLDAKTLTKEGGTKEGTKEGTKAKGWVGLPVL
jgi:superfamily II DNA or RNA helicase